MYAISENGWRSVGDSNEIAEGEVLVDDIPKWLSEKVRSDELKYMEGLDEPLDRVIMRKLL